MRSRASEIARRRGVPAPSVEFLRASDSPAVLRALRLNWLNLGYYLRLGRRIIAEEREGVKLFPFATALLESASAAQATAR